MKVTKTLETVTLPESEATSPGENGLFRLNYFNGRMLTAEALRKEQIYWDYRARLLGESQPAGVAWGLGVSWFSTQPPLAHRKTGEKFDETGGVSLNMKDPVFATLGPGLAFDGTGRPIVVVGGEGFKFDFRDLTNGFVSNQVVVVDGGTQFAPCVCLAPMPKTKWTPGPALPPGPYLLVARPTEIPEGEAKIYNHACATTKAVLCEADGFRGGFSLSLARFPVDVPLDEIPDIWTLRGVLSSYYFDVFEHSLIARWQRPFPLADGQVNFGAGTGRLDDQATAVPLAMVYIGSSNSVLFLDSWIPRRPLASTAAASWSANLRGAPTPSACIARLHQFQNQLQQSLAATGPLSVEDPTKNLYELGFRSIPPFGFLPIPEPTKGQQPLYFDDLIVFADRFGRRYFNGTNVFVYGAVAVHDDDLFEDMANALEKDPVQLDACVHEDNPMEPLTVQELKSLLGLLKRQKKPPAEPAPAPAPTSNDFTPGRPGTETQPRRDVTGGIVVSRDATTENTPPPRGEPTSREDLIYALRLLRRVFMPCGPLTMERLVNREIEIVKLLIPMEGQKRVHPIVGAVKADLSVSPFGVWPLFSRKGLPGKGTRLEALLGDVLGTTARPHGFVMYVKQRMVLLDVLYILLDAALDLLMFLVEVLTTATMMPAGAGAPGRATTLGSRGAELLRGVGLDEQFLQTIVQSFAPAYRRDPEVEYFSTHALRGLVEVRPLKAVGALVSLFADKTMRALMILLLLEVARELGFEKTWTSYDSELERITKSKLSNKVDAQEAERLARDEAIDLLLREHAGFGLIKLLAISLPAAEFTDIKKALQDEAKSAGAGKITLGQEVFYQDKPNHWTYDRWSSETATKLFLVARRLVGERLVSELADKPELRSSSVNTALLGTVSDMADWGTTDDVNQAVTKIRALGLNGAMVSAATYLSACAAELTFWRAYEDALMKANNDVSAALNDLVAHNGNNVDGYQALLTMFNFLGEGGFKKFVVEARKVGGV